MGTRKHFESAPPPRSVEATNVLALQLYDGPQEKCKSANVATQGSRLHVHVNATVHSKSSVGKPGAKLYGSRDAGSAHGGKPIEYRLGAGQVIAAWEEATLLLCKGHKGTLVVPPYQVAAWNQQQALAGRGGVAAPAGATLEFDFEVVAVMQADEDSKM